MGGCYAKTRRRRGYGYPRILGPILAQLRQGGERGHPTPSAPHSDSPAVLGAGRWLAILLERGSGVSQRARGNGDRGGTKRGLPGETQARAVAGGGICAFSGKMGAPATRGRVARGTRDVAARPRVQMWSSGAGAPCCATNSAPIERAAAWCRPGPRRARAGASRRLADALGGRLGGPVAARPPAARVLRVGGSRRSPPHERDDGGRGARVLEGLRARTARGGDGGTCTESSRSVSLGHPLPTAGRRPLTSHILSALIVRCVISWGRSAAPTLDARSSSSSPLERDPAPCALAAATAASPPSALRDPERSAPLSAAAPAVPSPVVSRCRPTSASAVRTSLVRISVDWKGMRRARSW